MPSLNTEPHIFLFWQAILSGEEEMDVTQYLNGSCKHENVLHLVDLELELVLEIIPQKVRIFQP
jgi:hypothetical protein